MSLPDKVEKETDILDEMEDLDEVQERLYSDLLGEVEPDQVENLIVDIVKQAVKDDLEFVSDKVIKRATEKAVMKVEDDIRKDISIDEIADGIISDVKKKVAQQRKKKMEESQNKVPDYFIFGVALILVAGAVFFVIKVVN
jgi:hypothetical protein